MDEDNAACESGCIRVSQLWLLLLLLLLPLAPPLIFLLVVLDKCKQDFYWRKSELTLEDTQLCQLTLAENGKKDFYWGKWQLTLNFVNEHSTWPIDMRFVRVYHVFC